MRSLRPLSGRVKPVSPLNVDANRYDWLNLENAEPNLGAPSELNRVITSGTNGVRSWAKPSDLIQPTDDLSVNTLNLNTSYITTESEAKGTIFWDDNNNTIAASVGNGVRLQFGQEVFYDVENDTGSQIDQGSVVRFDSTIGQSGKFTVVLGSASSAIPALYNIGIATQDIPNGETGKVTHFGKVRGIDTTGGSENWQSGDVLYVSPTVDGGLTNVKPDPPDHTIAIASVINVASNTGTIFVRVTYEPRLVDLDDVKNATVLDNTTPVYDSTNEYFELIDLDTKYVNLSGDTMTGVLTLSGDPSSPFHAATKQYVDDRISAATTGVSSVGNITGDISSTDLLDILKTVDGSGSGLDSDLLDGLDSSQFLRNDQNGSITGDLSVIGSVSASSFSGDLDYNDIINPPTIGDATITIDAGNGLSTGGNFTTNQTSNETITIDHADTSTQASANNSGRTYIQSVILDDFGHVTGLTSASETQSDTIYVEQSSEPSSPSSGDEWFDDANFVYYKYLGGFWTKIAEQFRTTTESGDTIVTEDNELIEYQ